MILLCYNKKIPLFPMTCLLKLDNYDQQARMGVLRLGFTAIVSGHVRDEKSF